METRLPKKVIKLPERAELEEKLLNAISVVRGAPTTELAKRTHALEQLLYQEGNSMTLEVLAMRVLALCLGCAWEPGEVPLLLERVLKILNLDESALSQVWGVVRIALEMGLEFLDQEEEELPAEPSLGAR